MYNLQWLKLEIKIFSNRKIQILLKETDGDTYFRVWIQLITIAMECNSEGKLVIGEKTPMTIENFSKIMGKSKKKIEKIIKKFQEQNRIRQQRYREKLKSEKEKSNVTITENNEVEDNTQEKNTRKENENNNGFREYKI